MNTRTPASRQFGFSLTELLIVIVIIGVLAAIGLPAYQNYARNSKRADAHQGLNRMAQLQERYFTDNNTYAANATLLGYGGNTPASTGGYWTLSVTAGDTAAFALQAVPTGGHVDADCNPITLDSTGSRGSPGAVDCWAGK